MVKQTPTAVFFFFFLFLYILTEVEGAKKSYGVYNSNPIKLFVFGDSYVDTGNAENSASYRPPYGNTFPGKPAGRFSDGHVLSDYIALLLNIESPIPYRLRNSSNVQYGINFAYGGTGIFNTLVNGPNVSIQIGLFEKVIEQKVYSISDVDSSFALVSASGNDYTTAVKNGKIWDFTGFVDSLVKQIALDLKRINSLRINKIAVGLLPPIGCLPVLNLGGIECIDLLNEVSRTHNEKLLQAIQELNKESGKLVFKTLDLYNSFLSTIETMQKKRAGNSTLMNPLRPCCEGVGLGNSCGDVDEKGAKKYCLCEKPEFSFFWDSVHPSQNGWDEVYTILQSSLSQLIEKNF